MKLTKKEEARIKSALIDDARHLLWDAGIRTSLKKNRKGQNVGLTEWRVEEKDECKHHTDYNLIRQLIKRGK